MSSLSSFTKMCCSVPTGGTEMLLCGADRWHRWWWIPPPRTRRRRRGPPARASRREAAAARELRLRFGVRGFRAGASFASRGTRGRRGSPLYQICLGQPRRPSDACEPGPAGARKAPPGPELGRPKWNRFSSRGQGSSTSRPKRPADEARLGCSLPFWSRRAQSRARGRPESAPIFCGLAEDVGVA